MKHKIIHGRKYAVKWFFSAKATNKFLDKNHEWGVIYETKKPGNKSTIYVARNNDKGIAPKTKAPE